MLHEAKYFDNRWPKFLTRKRQKLVLQKTNDLCHAALSFNNKKHTDGQLRKREREKFLDRF
jgi:hypothetical protein